MEKKSKEAAIAEIKEWADYLEVNTDTEVFTEVIDALLMPVVNNRLIFDLDSECFNLKLKKPIEMETKKIELVTIRPLIGGEIGKASSLKDGASFEYMLSKACNISMAEASKLYLMDINVINCIITSFFK